MDIIKLAQDGGYPGASRKAFDNRWATKEDFVNDAIIHTMLYRDAPNADPALQRAHLASVETAGDVGKAISLFCDAMLDSLLSYPRSFLLLHIGPLLEQHPKLKAAIVQDMNRSFAPWHEGYARLFAAFKIEMRPGWTIERYGLTLQSMLDGFLLRSRVQSEQMEECRSDGASLFADAVVAFTLGVIDIDKDGRSSRDALGFSVAPPRN
ncbi:hypothetical protein [Kribbella sp. NPDC051620]|uniref:hypothetical protein n=1 Tax=Kribbella sp. NPDC051620 TaxID=3364120 RepID=UPI0037A4423F